MRSNTTKYATRTNVDTKSVTMSFDENSLAFLMDVMTNLYSDTDAAPIREYSSNALDSHKAAGQTRPIEVRLPTMMSPMFTVQDFGLGMSEDDLFNIYSKYGYSTKRDNDVETGMLGLGSKSGLTYTDQFSVTARKGGVETIATVARGADGAGTINILAQSDTDKGNGVTISIPVHNVATFRQKALDFFRWWEPGTVLIDGEEPQFPKEDVLKISDYISIHRNNSLDDDYVVMGCVAYNVGDRLSRALPWGYHTVAYVPMGAVNFPPNREELQYTSKTNKVIEEIVERQANLIADVARRDIQSAATHADAVRARETWRFARIPTPEYKGKTIPDSLPDTTTRRDKFFVYFYNRYRNAVQAQFSIQTPMFARSLLVTGFTNVSLSPTNRKKATEYINRKGIDAECVIFASSNFAGDWADGVEQVDWDTIKAVKLPSAPRRPSGKAGLFETYDGMNKATVRGDDISGDDIIILSPSDIRQDKPHGHPYIRRCVINHIWPDATFVLLATNRWDKFKRENDNVRTIVDAITDYAKEFVDSLTDFEAAVLTGQATDFRGIKSLVPAAIDDPDVADLVRQARDARDVSTEMSRIRQVLRVRGDGENYGECPDIPDTTDAIRKVLDKYPMVKYAGSSDIPTEHTERYINLMYLDNKENK